MSGVPEPGRGRFKRLNTHFLMTHVELALERRSGVFMANLIGGELLREGNAIGRQNGKEGKKGLETFWSCVSDARVPFSIHRR